MPSSALNNLDARLKDISQLMAGHAELAGKTRGRKYEVEALNRASVVLLAAHLEGFIEDLVSESFAVLHNRGTTMAAIPTRIKAAQLESDVMRPIQHGDHRTANQRAQNLASIIADLWNPAVVASANNLRAAPILRQMSNAGTNEINTVFWYFDLDSVMDTISWKKAGSEVVQQNINELVGRRNAIAHGTVSVMVNKGDVKRYMKYVKGVAKKLDLLMETKLRDITNNAPW
jgi:hypothetical protein